MRIFTTGWAVTAITIVGAFLTITPIASANHEVMDNQEFFESLQSLDLSGVKSIQFSCFCAKPYANELIDSDSLDADDFEDGIDPVSKNVKDFMQKCAEYEGMIAHHGMTDDGWTRYHQLQSCYPSINIERAPF